MEPSEKRNTINSREHVLEHQTEIRTAERLQNMKQGIKASFEKALSRSVTTNQGKKPISLPFIDSEERINILRGRGPVFSLGDIGAPMINIPPDSAQLRERNALERHFEARRKESSQPNVSQSIGTRSPWASAEGHTSKHISDVSGVEDPVDNYPNSLVEDYFQGPAVPEHSVNQTERNSGRTDDDNNYRNGIIWSDSPSHGEGLDYQTHQRAYDRRQDLAPQTRQWKSAEECDLPDRMTRFDDLIDFGMRYGFARENHRGKG
jgi:hypothetical protein